MAATAITDSELMEERYDPEDALEEKVGRLARMVRGSRHFVAFTGAGISTSSGIPDFRGPEGKWTRAAMGKDPVKGVSVVDAFPTAAHMAIVELHRRGILKYLISQNCDGLHRRSGLPAVAISELHGNCWVEICESCGQQYFRDFKCDRVTKPGGPKCPTDHFTGRFCQCGGRLLNSTIDFGQALPQRPLQLAEEHSKRADLHLALGSSLTVHPACDQPKVTADVSGRLVIANLQTTPLTPRAAMHIYAKTDTVLVKLMEKLSIPIPPFRLCRRIVIGRSPGPRPLEVFVRSVDVHDPSLETLHVAGVDWDGAGAATPGPSRGTYTRRAQPGKLGKIAPTLHFFGHYREPPLAVSVDLSGAVAMDTTLVYDPYARSWAVASQCDLPTAELRAPEDARSGRIPDYGPSHREYCIRAVMQHRGCDEEGAARLVDQRVAEAVARARQPAPAQASRRGASPAVAGPLSARSASRARA